MSDEPPELRQPKKRVCVLQSSYEESTSAFKGLDPYCNPMWYAPEDYEWSSELIRKASAVQQVRDLVQSGKYDVFFNLCDGAFDEDRAGIEVPQALERFNAPYTGGDMQFYDPPKSLMKMMAFYCGIKTPRFVFAYNENDIATAAVELKFPLIVKHYNGYSSIGMTVNSRCTNQEQLQTEARRFISEFGGALIEEFIEGREFTVLVSENPEDPEHPIALLPIECVFSNGETFKHFDLKWKDFESIHWVPCGESEKELATQLREISRKIFVALHGTGYARTDIRVNAEGEAYFLEINPNCGIFYPTDSSHPDATQGGSADFILDNDSDMNHRDFITHVIKCAELRHAAKRKSTAVRYRPSHGYGLYAERDISPGELVYAYEERNQPVVTRKYVEKEWASDPVKTRWFKEYAWPLTEELWAIWSSDPGQWVPINHSCNPNSWLEGLNLIARVAIPKGAQITMDYATFCADQMGEFDCQCGSKLCRGRITAMDYLMPFVGERYGTHVSGFVATKRQLAEKTQQKQQKKKVYAMGAAAATTVAALSAAVGWYAWKR